jgi:hypothetical protein
MVRDFLSVYSVGWRDEIMAPLRTAGQDLKGGACPAWWPPLTALEPLAAH